MTHTILSDLVAYVVGGPHACGVGLDSDGFGFMELLRATGVSIASAPNLARLASGAVLEPEVLIVMFAAQVGREVARSP